MATTPERSAVRLSNGLRYDETAAAPRSSSPRNRPEAKDPLPRKRRRLLGDGFTTTSDDTLAPIRRGAADSEPATILNPSTKIASTIETNALSSNRQIVVGAPESILSNRCSDISDGNDFGSNIVCLAPPPARQPADHGGRLHPELRVHTRALARTESSERLCTPPLPPVAAHCGPVTEKAPPMMSDAEPRSPTPLKLTPMSITTHKKRRIHAVVLLLFTMGMAWVIINALRLNPTLHSTAYQHIILPNHVAARISNKDDKELDPESMVANLTLRQVLLDPSGYHLAMAPAFFGFYGYFGALAAWEEHIGPTVLGSPSLRSVAGASAGAMAAVLLAAGIRPRAAADFCGTVTLDKFADFPGILAAFRGNRFERIVSDFLVAATGGHARTDLQLQDAAIPVAVSAFDLQSLSGRVLRTGSMARAARASATFPFLFQPVGVPQENQELLCIDGGITDVAGLQGTKALLLEALASADASSNRSLHRVVNLSVGDFLGGSPPGPSNFGSHISESTVEVISISLRHLPLCGPWAMSNGPRAVEAAFRAMRASLNVPLHLGREDRHYELHIDTSRFWNGPN